MHAQAIFQYPAQVEAAGENSPILMEPQLLPRAEAHGGWVSVAAVSPSHWCWLGCSSSVVPWLFLAELVILTGCTSLLQGRDHSSVVLEIKNKAAPWGASCFQPMLL